MKKEEGILKKMLAIGIIALFVGASIIPIVSGETIKLDSVSSAIEKAQTDIKSNEPTGMGYWSDDFDNYTLYQKLDGGEDDGGWKGWDNVPEVGAYVTDNQSRSSPHSVDINGNVDLVHEFSGVSSDNWTFIAWQYIPNDFSGETDFLMLNTYEDGGPHNNPDWSNAISFSSETGNVKSWEGATLPIIYDQWVEIRVEIDFEADIQTIYYGSDELITKSWTAGVAPGGAKNLAAVDLYASDLPSTSVYYDDMDLEAEVPPTLPELEIESINGGFGVSAVIKNVGEGNATNVQWSIAFDGGIVIPKEKTGSIPILAPDDSENVKAIVFGFGKTTITVYAECAEGVSATGTVSGFVFLFFVLGVK